MANRLLNFSRSFVTEKRRWGRKRNLTRHSGKQQAPSPAASTQKDTTQASLRIYLCGPRGSGPQGGGGNKETPLGTSKTLETDRPSLRLLAPPPRGRARAPDLPTRPRGWHAGALARALRRVARGRLLGRHRRAPIYLFIKKKKEKKLLPELSCPRKNKPCFCSRLFFEFRCRRKRAGLCVGGAHTQGGGRAGRRESASGRALGASRTKPAKTTLLACRGTEGDLPLQGQTKNRRRPAKPAKAWVWK